MKKTKWLAICAMMAALAVAILAVGSLAESLDLSLAVLAGLVILVASTELGDRSAMVVFLVSAVLSLLLPARSGPICYVALFGWYPVVQKKIQMLPPVLCRLVKILVFNLALAAVLILSAFLSGLELLWVYGVLVVVGNVMFYVYDLLLDRVLIWYILKIHPRMKF